jgi:predicted anti-sigma-YlaC factor YlaD
VRRPIDGPPQVINARRAAASTTVQVLRAPAASVTAIGSPGTKRRWAGNPTRVRDDQCSVGARVMGLRWLLVVLGAVQTGIGFDDLERPAHALGELATWQLASAVALLTIARRPPAAEGLLPTLACVTLLTVYVSLRDIGAGRTSAAGELPHLWLVAGFATAVGLWMASGCGESHVEVVAERVELDPGQRDVAVQRPVDGAAHHLR